MKKTQMIDLLLLLLIVLAPCFTTIGLAQETASAQQQSQTAPATPPVKVKYEGGLVGYSEKKDGTLRIDDSARRVIFQDKFGKDALSIPFDSIHAVFADNRPRTEKAGVVGVGPFPFAGAWYVRKKRRYLVMQFEDPDTHAMGYTSFKFNSRELLDFMVKSLAGKLGLKERGEAYVRSRDENK